MKVSFERLVGPEYMLGAMRSTTGRDMYKKTLPKLETWYTMLVSPHSSARSVNYRFYVEDIPYYAHVYLIRHHVGFQPHVLSQRDDEGKRETTERDEKPQNVPISMLFDVNSSALMQIAQRRLCYKSHRIVQEVLEKIKCSLIYTGDSYDKVLGKLLMRPCSFYKGYCPEPKPCGRVPGVTSLRELHMKVLEDEDLKNDSY